LGYKNILFFIGPPQNFDYLENLWYNSDKILAKNTQNHPLLTHFQLIIQMLGIKFGKNGAHFFFQVFKGTKWRKKDG
jgi:hypothetical protein